jgi:cell wall-associated NlpC family hydrolase
MKLLLLPLLLAVMPAPHIESMNGWLERNMGRPYVWGATGYKSYDCSGVVWRMLSDHGVYLKRTTARKLFVSLKKPAAGEKPAFGTLIFFNDLKHVGIVLDSNRFYHAASSKGTMISEMTPFWKRMVVGYRELPMPAN